MIENYPTNVVAAFEMLLEEIETEIDFVNRIGTRAFESRDYERAQEALQHAAQITAFRDKVDGLRREWGTFLGREADEEYAETRAARRNLGRLRRGLGTREEAYYRPILQVLDSLGGSVPMGQVLARVHQLICQLQTSQKGQSRAQAFDKLRLSIPSATTPTSLVASRPVQIKPAKDAAGTHIQARILVSGLEAKQLTRLLIPINNESDARLVELLNGPDLTVKIVDSSNISNPVLLALRDAVVPAALVSLLLALAMAWFQYRIEKIRSKLDKPQAEATAKLDTLQAEAATKIQHLTAQLDTTSNSLSRIKVLLLARLADYVKELEF